jgi:tetratricopeptide (TPR) repeat protein
MSVRALTARLAAAITAIERAWGRYRVRLAVGHAALGHPDDALRHARKAAAHLVRAGNADLDLAAALDTLATCQQELGQLEDAAKARRRSVDILNTEAPGSTEWAAALVKLGDLYRFQGHYDQAQELLSQALDGATEDPTDGIPLRATVLNALGILCKDTGRYDEAAGAYAEALELISAVNGPDHPRAAALWLNLAGLAYARGHPDQAEPLAAHAVQIRERQHGRDHHLVAQDLAVLGAALLDQNRVDEAEPLFERALTIFRRRHPADQYEVAVNLGNLAACHIVRGDPATAERLFRQALTIKQAILGPNHPEIARQLNNLAVAVEQQHRPDEATDLHQRALSILELTLPPSHPLIATSRANEETNHTPDDCEAPVVVTRGSCLRHFSIGSHVGSVRSHCRKGPSARRTKPMNRNNLKRIFVTFAITAGMVTGAAGRAGAGPVAQVAAVSGPVSVVSYDIIQTPLSGWGQWAHVYSGAIVDTGRTTGPDCVAGTQIANYSGGSGTINDGVTDAANTDSTHLLCMGAASDGQPVRPEITVRFAQAVFIDRIIVHGGGASFNIYPGAIDSATVRIGATQATVISVPAGTPNDIGVLRDDVFDLTTTSLSSIPTTEASLSDIVTSYFGVPLNQAAIAEITVEGRVAAIPVDLDIRPLSNSNVISLKSRIPIPIAVLSSSTLDVHSLDVATLTFGHSGQEDSLLACARVPDINRDRRPDLVCLAATQRTAFAIGDVEGHLRGRTTSGADIHGSDTVNIRP